MYTEDQIIEAMEKENSYGGMIELYHAQFGIVYTYAWYNQEELYLLEDLEAPLNDFSFKQFLSDDKIIEIMEKSR